MAGRLAGLWLVTLPVWSGSLFDLPELQVRPSPSQAASLALPAGLKPLALSVAPDRPEVLLAAADSSGAGRLLNWTIGEPQARTVWSSPGVQLHGVTWRPDGKMAFAAGSQGGEWRIWSLVPAGESWTAKPIYRSRRSMQGLVAGPRPFRIGYDSERDRDLAAYRLFFGSQLDGGGYRVESITETGARAYWVVGPGKKPQGDPDSGDWRLAGGLPAASAVPEAFHPGGHLLLWRDAKGCFQVARYGGDRWETTAPLFGGRICSGGLAPIPNGLGLLHWRTEGDGVLLYWDGGRSTQRLASGRKFESAPQPTADGRGLVGVVREADRYRLDYVPVAIPLADVTNAWMFVAGAEDRDLFLRHGGLLRPLDADQLYSLYESELYACAESPLSRPLRPYLVTTDIFWELFGAAFQGLFILRERLQAVPAFWGFVESARRHLPPQSRWGRMFGAVAALRSGRPPQDEEAQRILRAQDRVFSPVLGGEFDYTELKPRGHYTASEDLDRYFRAFRYRAGPRKTKLCSESRISPSCDVCRLW